jgi:hypothetical protein
MEKGMTTIEKLKVGDLFKLPGRERVYVRGGYNHSIKKYSATRYDDIGHYIEKKTGTIVEII